MPLVFFQEKLATIRGDHLAMSPVLARRNLTSADLDKSGKVSGNTFAGMVPQATLDLSGPANASGSRGALELSTLV